MAKANSAWEPRKGKRNDGEDGGAHESEKECGRKCHEPKRGRIVAGNEPHRNCKPGNRQEQDAKAEIEATQCKPRQRKPKPLIAKAVLANVDECVEKQAAKAGDADKRDEECCQLRATYRCFVHRMREESPNM